MPSLIWKPDFLASFAIGMYMYYYWTPIGHGKKSKTKFINIKHFKSFAILNSHTLYKIFILFLWNSNKIITINIFFLGILTKF